MSYNSFGQATSSVPVTIYHENFNSASGSTWGEGGQSGWNGKSTTANPLPLSSGPNYIATSASSTKNSIYTFQLPAVSTKGYKDVYIHWIGKKAKQTAKIKLLYSTDGGINFTQVEENRYLDVDSTKEANLPEDWKYFNVVNDTPTPLKVSEVADKESVIFRWSFIAAADRAHYSIDDITITGLPTVGSSVYDFKVGHNPFTYPTATPIDGVEAIWTEASPTGITNKSQLVVTEYQDKNALRLKQSGASTSVGGSYKLSFNNKTVKDLSFSLLDVDQTDIVSITGRNNGSIVPVIRNKAQITQYNSFTLSSRRVSAKSTAGNITPSSSAANFTYTFAEPVDEVTLTFYNGSTSGLEQDIAISDVSWQYVAPQSPLPVNLVSFEAKKVADGAKLEWATATEINNEKFVVERSRDAKTFEAIGEVQGNGNSNVLLSYSFTDQNVQPGITYYRLTQYDFDGQFESSKVVAFKNNAAPSVVSISTYPNPTPGELTIEPSAASGQDQTIHILNTAGSLVKTVVLPKNTPSVQISVQDLPSGLYFIKSAAGTTRFMKQ